MLDPTSARSNRNRSRLFSFLAWLRTLDPMLGKTHNLVISNGVCEVRTLSRRTLFVR